MKTIKNFNEFRNEVIKLAEKKLTKEKFDEFMKSPNLPIGFKFSTTNINRLKLWEAEYFLQELGIEISKEWIDRINSFEGLNPGEEGVAGSNAELRHNAMKELIVNKMFLLKHIKSGIVFKMVNIGNDGFISNLTEDQLEKFGFKSKIFSDKEKIKGNVNGSIRITTEGHIILNSNGKWQMEDTNCNYKILK